MTTQESSPSGWGGRNKNYADLKAAKKPETFQHLPLPRHAAQMLPPTDKLYSAKGGSTEYAYRFVDWQTLCPEEAAFNTVKRVIGAEVVSVLTSPDAEASPAHTLMRSVLSKLVVIGALEVSINPQTGDLVPPSFKVVNEHFEQALASGDPVNYLDDIIGRPTSAPVPE